MPCGFKEINQSVASQLFFSDGSPDFLYVSAKDPLVIGRDRIDEDLNLVTNLAINQSNDTRDFAEAVRAQCKLAQGGLQMLKAKQAEDYLSSTFFGEKSQPESCKTIESETCSFFLIDLVDRISRLQQAKLIRKASEPMRLLHSPFTLSLKQTTVERLSKFSNAKEPRLLTRLCSLFFNHISAMRQQGSTLEDLFTTDMKGFLGDRIMEIKKL